ncbi:basic secretory protein-like protein [Parapedobacter koreensis]|uniref:Peptidase n=1 Tax=Parapedobacter koreensis TaxID=332977 RepID=A0A1H7JD55_9SPHI|nr:basic secretory protein-like protein [Parapedobacter koreensis]SEK71255.1 Peptidase [Parapedobacter koreensis]
MIRFLFAALLFLQFQGSLVACAIDRPLATLKKEQGKADTLVQNGFQLIFVQQDPDFDSHVATRLKETFFQVYPVLVATYNPDAVHHVTLTIDTAYDGVAYAHDGRVVISQAWLKKMPRDVDVVTHEVMHIVQAYPSGSGPGWIIEGIADYVRYKYGVDNVGAGWSLPDVQEEHHYTNSYRIAARFLDWIEQTRKKEFVKTLDKAMRVRAYTEAIWRAETGLGLDELWAAYATSGNGKE